MARSVAKPEQCGDIPRLSFVMKNTAKKIEAAPMRSISHRGGFWICRLGRLVEGFAAFGRYLFAGYALTVHSPPRIPDVGEYERNEQRYDTHRFQGELR